MPDLEKRIHLNRQSVRWHWQDSQGQKWEATIRQTQVLKKTLDLRGMTICNQWFSSFLISRPYEETEAAFIEQCDFLKKVGAKCIGVSEQSYSIQGKLDHPIQEGKYVMNDEEWDRL